MAENNNGGKLAAASDVKEINIDDLISKKEEETPTEVFGCDVNIYELSITCKKDLIVRPFI